MWPCFEIKTVSHLKSNVAEFQEFLISLFSNQHENLGFLPRDLAIASSCRASRSVALRRRRPGDAWCHDCKKLKLKGGSGPRWKLSKLHPKFTAPRGGCSIMRRKFCAAKIKYWRRCEVRGWRRRVRRLRLRCASGRFRWIIVLNAHFEDGIGSQCCRNGGKYKLWNNLHWKKNKLHRKNPTNASSH